MKVKFVGFNKPDPDNLRLTQEREAVQLPDALWQIKEMPQMRREVADGHRAVQARRPIAGSG